MSLIEGQKFADYEVLARLGSGGMGEVYLVRQVVLKRRVALKLLAPQHAANESFIARFQSEATLAANLNHPNIVQVYTAGLSEGVHYIAMEYVEGETLHSRLQVHGPLTPEVALDVLYYVALALSHAWTQAQLIHRDIKPDNIFIAANGEVKLGDFGLSKSLSEWADHLTMPGTPMGSPHYISPEQARGDDTVDFRTDIYSLGCTLFHALTGRRVFEDDSPFTAAVKHINDAPPALEQFLPACPPALATLVDRMLCKDPAGRPQSYEELLGDILRARQSLQEPPVPAGRNARPTGAAASGPWGWILNTVLILALLSTLGLAAYALAPWPQWLQKWQATQPLTEPAGLRKFKAEVASLKPDQQVETVMARLRELNPGFQGKGKYTVEDDQVVELAFPSVGITNLWPVSALVHLRSFRCAGDPEAPTPSALSDLAPLRNLWLEELDCSWTQVRNLAPVADMDLKILLCRGTPLTDLTPLRSLRLEEFDCSWTQVTDLSPLKGMPLFSLRCEGSPVKTLEPLRELPLQRLWCDRRSQRDLALIHSLKDLVELDGTNLASALHSTKKHDSPRTTNSRPRGRS